MTVDPETPTFNLKVVVRETGIKPDTLRAWERRYGVPDPARTSGGHRLYSQRDIDTLKWLVARQQEGLSISRAVDLWQSLEEENQDPLLAMPIYVGASTHPPVFSAESGDVIADLRQSWLAACLEFDERRAEEVVTHALGLFPPETVCMEIMQEGLSEIGDLWYERQATVQQEHFASALAIRRVEALIATAPPPTRPGRVVVACPPNEQHIYGPLVITLLLRRQGWDVLYLGANVPIEQFHETIQTTNPNLVILSAQQLATAATLMQTAQALNEMEMSVAYGGRIFNILPRLRERIPGHFLGQELGSVATQVEKLVLRPTANPTVEPTGAKYLETLDDYRRQQSLIEATVANGTDEMSLEAPHMEQANLGLSLGIRAALRLGDTSLLDYDIDWIAGLLVHHDIPVQALDGYLWLYKQAVAQHMNQHSDLVVEMLEGLMERED